MKKSHTGVTPYGLYHDCRCPVPPLRTQLPSTKIVSCRRDNFATAAPGIGDGIADIRPLGLRRLPHPRPDKTPQ
jgi:hypothetical protein